MRPGQVERRTHDYTRHGTTSLFAALNVKTGKVIGEFHHRHRAAEFRRFLDTIEAAVPPPLDVAGDQRRGDTAALPHLALVVGRSGPAYAPVRVGAVGQGGGFAVGPLVS